MLDIVISRIRDAAVLHKEYGAMALATVLPMLEM